MKSFITTTIVASLMIGGCGKSQLMRSPDYVPPIFSPYGTMSMDERYEYQGRYEAIRDQHQRQAHADGGESVKTVVGPPVIPMPPSKGSE